MDDETRKEARPYPGEAQECPAPRPHREDVCKLLHIARKVEEFVNRGGWSWCTMDKVYWILKAAHR